LQGRGSGRCRHTSKQSAQLVNIAAFLELELEVLLGEVKLGKTVLVHELDDAADFLEVHDEKELVLGGRGRPDATLPCRRQASGADEIASSGKRTIASDTV
jgi:hypothetical protein